MSAMSILVVEDEPNLAQQVTTSLEEAGYAVDVVGDGEEAHFMGETEPYDAVVLDLGLPVMDGVSVLEKWRTAGLTMPVLILTARDTWTDKVAGLDAGADDYLTKPFKIEELLARLRALIRRSAGHASSELSCGPVVLNTKTSKVTADGRAIKMTALEYKLLSYLMHHQDEIISRTVLTEHIYDQDFDRDSNTIEVFINRIRKKLGANIIQTKRGLGYRLAEADEEN